MNGTQQQQIVTKHVYNQRLRESSQQANIWENMIGPSLSVIPGHSTSSGQCSPLGRKDKVCKWPRSWWAARDNWNITYNVWQPSKKSTLMTNLSVRHMQTREHHYSYVLGHKSFVTLDRIMAPQHFWNKSLVEHQVASMLSLGVAYSTFLKLLVPWQILELNWVLCLVHCLQLYPLATYT